MSCWQQDLNPDLLWQELTAFGVVQHQMILLSI